MTGLVDRTLIAIEKKGELADSTRAQYALAAREIKTTFIDFAPDQVRQTDIAKFHDFHIDRPNMANRYLTLLRVIFDYAIRWGEATHNPAIGVKRHKEKARTRYLTDGGVRCDPRRGIPLGVCLHGPALSDGTADQ